MSLSLRLARPVAVACIDGIADRVGDQLQNLQLPVVRECEEIGHVPSYGQFCPIAQASEVITERWTPLVLRELALTGSRRFNDIQRGVPLMSSSLLSKRLRELERAGIIERRALPNARGSEYHLTSAGQELGPVLAQIGIWSERWLRRPIFEKSPDTGLLMWWVRTTVKAEALPAGRTVIHFRFAGAPEKLRYFWLVLPETDLCLTDPGFGVDVTVTSDAKTLTAVWMGDVPLASAVKSHAVELEGRRALTRSFADWFGLHPLFSGVAHPASRPRVSAKRTANSAKVDHAEPPTQRSTP